MACGDIICLTMRERGERQKWYVCVCVCNKNIIRKMNVSNRI